jgi:hypothetical protein
VVDVHGRIALSSMIYTQIYMAVQLIQCAGNMLYCLLMLFGLLYQTGICLLSVLYVLIWFVMEIHSYPDITTTAEVVHFENGFCTNFFVTRTRIQLAFIVEITVTKQISFLCVLQGVVYLPANTWLINNWVFWVKCLCIV